MVVAQQIASTDQLFPGPVKPSQVVCSEDGRKIVALQQEALLVYDISGANRYNIQLPDDGETILECCHATATDVLLVMTSGSLWLVSIE